MHFYEGILLMSSICLVKRKIHRDHTHAFYIYSVLLEHITRKPFNGTQHSVSLSQSNEKMHDCDHNGRRMKLPCKEMQYVHLSTIELAKNEKTRLPVLLLLLYKSMSTFTGRLNIL